jgi:hypothetical protein
MTEEIVSRKLGKSSQKNPIQPLAPAPAAAGGEQMDVENVEERRRNCECSIM